MGRSGPAEILGHDFLAGGFHQPQQIRQFGVGMLAQPVLSRGFTGLGTATPTLIFATPCWLTRRISSGQVPLPPCRASGTLDARWMASSRSKSTSGVTPGGYRGRARCPPIPPADRCRYGGGRAPRPPPRSSSAARPRPDTLAHRRYGPARPRRKRHRSPPVAPPRLANVFRQRLAGGVNHQPAETGAKRLTDERDIAAVI